MKEFRVAWVVLGWMFTGLIGFTRFLIKNPRAIPSIPKYVISNLYKVRKRIRHEARLGKGQIMIAQQLDECAALYLKLKPTDDTDILNWLKEARSSVADRWTLLYLLVRVLKPNIVVETGVAEGKSTSFILQGLADNGKGSLVSIDFPNQLYILDNGQLHGDILPFRGRLGRLISDRLRSRWRLITGDSRNELPPLLASLGEIDLFLHDSEHTYKTMRFEFLCVWPHLRPSGYLVVDDMNCNSSFFDFASEKGIRPMRIGDLGFIRKPKYFSNLEE